METVRQSQINVYKIILKTVENPQILLAACQSPRGQKQAVGVATDRDHLVLKGDVPPLFLRIENSRQNSFGKCWMKTLIVIMPIYSLQLYK